MHLLTPSQDKETPQTARKNLNISWFVFRDINRDGIYNASDRPYAGLKVNLLKNGDQIASSRSNVNGFANFRMSRSGDHGSIVEEGLYELIAASPPGWAITSGSESTSLSFRFLDLAPAGIVADSIPAGLGVAPVSSISGSYTGDVGQHALIGKKEEEAHPILVSTDGQFSMSCSEYAALELVIDQVSAARSKFQIPCDFFPTRLSTSYFHAKDSIANARAVTVGYDNLNRSEALTKIPNDYAGLEWHNWIATHNLFYNGPGYVNGTITGDYINYNSSGHPAMISRSTPFDFISTYIGVAWPGATNGDVVIEGYRDDERIYSDRLHLNEHGPIKFIANYFDVTEVRIHSEVYWQVILEDSVFQL